ncbi:MAG: hypothetical protein ACYC37_00180 [Desulfobacteria bacterium]
MALSMAVSAVLLSLFITASRIASSHKSGSSGRILNASLKYLATLAGSPTLTESDTSLEWIS